MEGGKETMFGKNRRHCWVDQKGHLTHRPASTFPGDLILSVFIPGPGDTSDDVPAEGFEVDLNSGGVAGRRLQLSRASFLDTWWAFGLDPQIKNSTSE